MAKYTRLQDGGLEEQRESLLDERTKLSDPKLLRGAPFPVVVGGLGRLLDPSGTIAASGGEEPTEDTFVHSNQVDIIQYFLSHSWRDSGKLKWLALLVQVNFSFAMMSGYLCAAIVLVIVMIFPEVYPFPGVKLD